MSRADHLALCSHAPRTRLLLPSRHLELASTSVTQRVEFHAGRYAQRQNTPGARQRSVNTMAAFAELERDIIHERTMAGLKAARAQGKVGGRPTVMDPDKLAAARARRARGESPTQIAKALGVSRASVYRHLGGEAQKA